MVCLGRAGRLGLVEAAPRSRSGIREDLGLLAVVLAIAAQLPARRPAASA